MISKQYVTGLALLVMSVCSRGPVWLDLIVGVIGVAMVWTDKEADALEAAREDAERYRWLRDSKACSMSVSFNDHHSMYQSVQQTVECSEGYYDEMPEGELRRMIETDTIWTVHVYPRTPVGFDVFHGATLDAAIDQARGKGGA